MPKPKTRRTALFCNVLSPGPLVMVKMPEAFVAWSVIRREIHASLRREHGVLAKDVHAIEAFAGIIDGDTDGGQGLQLCNRAFAGHADALHAFALHAWDSDTSTFTLFRPAAQ